MNRKIRVLVGVLLATGMLSVPAFASAQEIQRSHPDEQTQAVRSVDVSEAEGPKDAGASSAPSASAGQGSGQTSVSRPASPVESPASSPAVASGKDGSSADGNGHNDGVQTQAAEQRGTRQAPGAQSQGPTVRDGVTYERSGATLTVTTSASGGLVSKSEFRSKYDRSVQTVRFVGKAIFPQDSSEFFSVAVNDGTQLTAIEGLGDADMSHVTDMHEMFYRCKKLASVDVSGWNTGAVTNMSGLFDFCESLTALEVSGWNTAAVTDMRNMFEQCNELTVLDVSGWDTGNVRDMGYLFQACYKLPNATFSGVSGWNTGSVTDMYEMFEFCYSLSSLDLSRWNTGNVKDISGMFNYDYALTDLNVSSWDTGNVVRMYQVFHGCTGLPNLDVSGWNTGKVEDMDDMFSDTHFRKLDIADWDVRHVTHVQRMFAESQLKSLDLTGWDTRALINGYDTDMNQMFQDCGYLTQLSVGSNTKLRPQAFDSRMGTQAYTSEHNPLVWIQLAIPGTVSQSARKGPYNSDELAARTQDATKADRIGTYVLARQRTLTLKANAPAGTNPDIAEKKTTLVHGVGHDVPVYDGGGHLTVVIAQLGDDYGDADYWSPDVRLPSNPFTLDRPDGYRFSGWGTASNGGRLYSVDDYLYLYDGDVTLYAQWGRLYRYSLAFDANGTGVGSMPAGLSYGNVAEGSHDFTIPSGSPTRGGYRFMGWNTRPDGSGQGPVDGKMTVTAADPSVTLYAQWVPEYQYSLTFQSGLPTGGSISRPLAPVTGERTTATSDSLTVPGGYTFSRDDTNRFRFDGWKSDIDGHVYQAGEAVGLDSSHPHAVLTGQWTRVYDYELRFDSGQADGHAVTGTTFEPVRANGRTERSYTLRVPSANTLTDPAGRYAFHGWKSDVDGRVYQPGEMVTLAGSHPIVTLQGVWQAVPAAGGGIGGGPGMPGNAPGFTPAGPTLPGSASAVTLNATGGAPTSPSPKARRGIPRCTTNEASYMVDAEGYRVLSDGSKCIEVAPRNTVGSVNVPVAGTNWGSVCLWWLFLLLAMLLFLFACARRDRLIISRHRAPEVTV
ncbi:BspA family leucine-rich repeat surface protein [Bifidobacterium sp. ESL0763]|uniref:BspA family leucine-rich repeat surface protein n=1 Tax=Bifidobacterium sp. ESL0763 TaxID=2983227 RepID=UPI0023F8A308|nr:BspA family leucine-rich repeat surface protein [Bifidobacterium sp. ESL0763]MDF7664119.1 BspA family leucine-rich repeat surface protein [Bifidobacterium sp. ESL0763]